MKTLVSMLVLAAGLTAAADGGNRWLRYGGSCANAKELARCKTFVDRAAQAGMNGMTLHGLDDLWRWSESAKRCLRELKAYADARGVRLVPHGWSVGYGILTGAMPELVETTAFRDMPFVAEGGRIVPCKGGIVLDNGSLADFDRAKNTFRGWSADHPGLLSFVDTNVGHAGKASVRFEPGPEKDKHGHARFFRHVELTPGRRYRFSGWVKGTGLEGRYRPIELKVYPDGGGLGGETPFGTGRTFKAGDDGWYRLSADFCTGDAGGAQLFFGSWAGKSLQGARFWLSDLSLEEIGVTELSRRETAPRTLRSAATGRIYEEGRDWTLAKTKRGEEVRMDLPVGSRIADGERLLFGGYMVSRAGTKLQISTCMSDPRLYAALEKSAQAIEEILHPGVWFLSLDEIRNGGTCELCSQRKTDMAHILGDCVTKMRDIIRSVDPQAEIFAWSDMFDPWHNAKERVGGCRGSFVGVADLIPADVGMMFWHGGILDRSVPYFAGRKHAFMGSICCDAPDAERVRKTVRNWREKLSPHPGLRGFMYTTWIDNYDHIDLFVSELK
ncbi:MAG: carbohydrate binding domain-containing protein [Kiritimatiellia bacterium]